MIKIAFADRQTSMKIQRRWFARLARHVLAAESISDADLSIAFVADSEMHQLNRQFLAHDYPTDVLTFPLSEGDSPLAGEIVISTEYAASQAVEYGTTPRDEAALYLTHGILHLCGYDDQGKAKAKVMVARQEALLQSFLQAEMGGRPADAAENSTRSK